MYAAMVGDVDGVRLLKRQTVDMAREECSHGPDATIEGIETRFGLGFHLNTQHVRMTGPGSFGHPGAGGSLGFADPEHQVGFGYVMNRLGPSPYIDERASTLISAVRQSIGS